MLSEAGVDPVRKCGRLSGRFAAPFLRHLEEARRRIRPTAATYILRDVLGWLRVKTHLYMYTLTLVFFDSVRVSPGLQDGPWTKRAAHRKPKHDVPSSQGG